MINLLHTIGTLPLFVKQRAVFSIRRYSQSVHDAHNIYIYIYLFRYAHPFIAGRYLQKRPKRESRQNQQRICQRPGFRSSAGKSFHYSLKCIYVSDHLKSCQIEDIHFRFWKFPFLCIWGGLQSLWSPSVPVSVPSLPPSLLYSYRHLSRSV